MIATHLNTICDQCSVSAGNLLFRVVTGSGDFLKSEKYAKPVEATVICTGWALVKKGWGIVPQKCEAWSRRGEAWSRKRVRLGPEGVRHGPEKGWGLVQKGWGMVPKKGWGLTHDKYLPHCLPQGPVGTRFNRGWDSSLSYRGCPYNSSLSWGVTLNIWWSMPLFFIFYLTDWYWDEYILHTVILLCACMVVWTWSGLEACLCRSCIDVIVIRVKVSREFWHSPQWGSTVRTL